MRRRRTRAGWRTTVIALLATVIVLSAAPASAAVSVITGGEVGGGSVAARLAASALRDPWSAALTARGAAPPAPSILAGPVGTPVTGVLLTAADGTTAAVQRARYSTDASPVFVANSPNPGTAVCTGAGLTLQGGAPRPSVILGNTGCTNGNGFAFTSFGGAGENTTRDALDFTFSRPVLGFGAWFADLETRTDGAGIPALLRLYDSAGVLLSEQTIAPVGSQAGCGGDIAACGNNTTRWVGFVADTATPVSRMVVIVGDNELAGGAVNVGFGFIGPSLVTDRAGIALTVAAPTGPVALGDVIAYDLALANTGTVTVTGAAVTADGPASLSCPGTDVAPGATLSCTATHTVTQEDVDAGVILRSWSATGSAWGGPVAAVPQPSTVPVVQTRALEVTMTADRATYSAAGDVVSYDIVVRNTGTVTLAPPSVSTDLAAADCAPVAALAPGAALACTAAYTVPSAGAAVANTARASTDAGAVTASSAAVVVAYVAVPPPPPVDPVDPVDPAAPSPGDPPTGQLARSGGADPTAFASIALALIAVGGVLLRIRRRTTPAGPDVNKG
ncbi:hypothetical protein [Microbacterium sp. RU33B]|uniref:DUF7507 domain-containing protein n=1 Tax=Microbacterium sp. RU33B TaxID=1907390 RepID=UPI0009648E2C|nr:hypothetical protein [Microbacterium sp. RU33B]SIT88352.1 conserved repeat domain-containing protein [Microbacterium sp. RU33B]